jgi:hypothetical protein
MSNMPATDFQCLSLSRSVPLRHMRQEILANGIVSDGTATVMKSA